MALALTSALSPDWYTPPSQTEESDPVSFLLAPLSAAGFLNAQSVVGNDRYGDAAMMVCRECVKDWRNVTVDGDCKFATGRLNALPAVFISEIATEIIRRASLTESERKNSSSPSI